MKPIVMKHVGTISTNHVQDDTKTYHEVPMLPLPPCCSRGWWYLSIPSFIQVGGEEAPSTTGSWDSEEIHIGRSEGGRVRHILEIAD